MRAPVLVLCTIGCALGGASAAATPGVEDARAQPGLSGPTQQTPVQAATLIRRDFEGRLVRPAAPVEAEALKLLGLSEDALAPALAVITERARAFDRIVVDHLDLIVQAEATFTAGSGGDKASMILRAVHALDPVNRGGPLDQRVRRALPARARAEFDRLLREYWDAVVRDVRAAVTPVADRMMAPQTDVGRDGEAQAAGERSRFEIVLAEKSQELGQEIERAVQRQIQSGGLLAAYLCKGMTLSEAQRARVHAACAEYMSRAGENGTPVEHLRLAATLLPILEPSQRQQLLANVVGYQQATARPAQKAAGEAVDEMPRGGKPER